MKSPVLPVDRIAGANRRKPRRTQPQQVRQEARARPSPEADLAVDRLGEVHGGSMMIAAERILVLPAARLIYTAVHVKVHVTAGLDLALNEGVRVENVDKLGVAGVEFLVVTDGYEERHCGIEAGYATELVRPESVRGVGRNVSAEAEADNVDVLGAPISQSLDQLGETIADVRHVVNGDRIARCNGQTMPIDGYEIRLLPHQVLVPYVDQRVELHVGVVAVDDYLRGFPWIEVRAVQIRRCLVHQDLVAGRRVVSRVQEERHLLVGTGLVAVDQARPDEVVPALVHLEIGRPDDVVSLSHSARHNETLGEGFAEEGRRDERAHHQQAKTDQMPRTTVTGAPIMRSVHPLGLEVDESPRRRAATCRRSDVAQL